jgi:hypothetical protein
VTRCLTIANKHNIVQLIYDDEWSAPIVAVFLLEIPSPPGRHRPAAIGAGGTADFIELRPRKGTGKRKSAAAAAAEVIG